MVPEISDDSSLLGQLHVSLICNIRASSLSEKLPLIQRYSLNTACCARI